MKPVENFAHGNDSVHRLVNLLGLVTLVLPADGYFLLAAQLAVQVVLPRHLVSGVYLVWQSQLRTSEVNHVGFCHFLQGNISIR